MKHILSFDVAKGKSVYCFLDEKRNVIKKRKVSLSIKSLTK